MDDSTKRSELYREIMNEVQAGMDIRMRLEKETKVHNFRALNRNAIKGGILFTGSSLMEHFPVTEIAFREGIRVPVYNRGIGGTTTDEFLEHIHEVLIDLCPSKVFLNIGTNDMTDRVYGSRWMEHLTENYDKILEKALEAIPNVTIYTMAYYPANLHMPGRTPEMLNWMKERTPENIRECSRRVEELAKKYGQRYIDVNDGLTDENGELREEYSIEGVHMYAEAYELIFRNLKPYILE